MKTITLSDLKNNGSKAISNDEVSILIVNSTPKTALVPMDIFTMYEDALEELEDLKDTIARKDEPTVPADQVFQDILGDK
ncbi:MAG: hypothetical protein WCJ58_05830 [bacterium]